MVYPVWAAGQRITASMLTAMQPLTVVKTADESLTNNTTLQNDDELFLSLAANATYQVDGWIQYTASSTGDIKVDATIPSGATMTWSMGGTGNGSLTNNDVSAFPNSTARVSEGNGGTAQTIPVRGYVVTTTTSGTLQFRWSQSTADAVTATIVKAGSWLRAVRTA